MKVVPFREREEGDDPDGDYDDDEQTFDLNQPQQKEKMTAPKRLIRKFAAVDKAGKKQGAAMSLANAIGELGLSDSETEALCELQVGETLQRRGEDGLKQTTATLDFWCTTGSSCDIMPINSRR